MPTEARTAAGVKSSCETPDLGAGIQLKFSEGQQVLLATEPPLEPTVSTLSKGAQTTQTLYILMRLPKPQLYQELFPPCQALHPARQL